MEWITPFWILFWLFLTGLAALLGIWLSHRFSATWRSGFLASGYQAPMPLARGKWVDWVFVTWFAMAAAYLVFWLEKPALETVGLLWFVWVMGCSALVDARTALLPNEATLTLMLSGFVWQVLLTHDIPHEQYLWGMVLGYLIPVLMNVVCHPFYRKAVVGLGDAKLLAGIGMWLGVSALPSVWLIASIALLVYTASWWVWSGRRLLCLPFGPFLVFGASMVLWQCCLK